MRSTLATASLAVLLTAFSGSSVRAQDPGVYSMLAEMRRQSHADALTIKEVYAPMLESTRFENRDALTQAIEAGELVPLSELGSLGLSNLQPRLSGESPIAQKDMENQHLYVAARPAVMGLLLEIGRRVDGAPLEITSLVRTTEYQRALMRGNGNANTDVPTHTMGYAVDIGLKYMAPDVAARLRQTLEGMRAAGDIYFIGERNQLTFHIVPVPARIPHFEEVYRQARADADAAAATDAAAAASAPVPPPATPAPARSDDGPLSGIWSWVTRLFE